MSKIKYYDRPVLFYFLSTFITWVAWGIAAILSHVYPQNEALCALLLFLGLISPAVVAFTLMYSNNKLRNDFFPRLLQFSNIKPIYNEVFSSARTHDLKSKPLQQIVNITFPSDNQMKVFFRYYGYHYGYQGDSMEDYVPLKQFKGLFEYNPQQRIFIEKR